MTPDVSFHLLPSRTFGYAIIAEGIERENQKAFDQVIEGVELRWRIAALEAPEAQRAERQARKPRPIASTGLPGMLTIEDVAERLKVSRRTVERHIEDGSLKASRIGGKGQYRIKAEDVEKLLIVTRERRSTGSAYSKDDWT